MNEKSKIKVLFSKLGNGLAVILLKIIAYLPFCILYLLSDMFAFIIKNIVKYRSNVIVENLKYAFPEKSHDELTKLRDKFYCNLCDISLEAVKQYHISQKQIEKRMVFNGVDIVDDFVKRSNGAIILSFHYNNWEWTGALQQSTNHKLLMVYNKMRDNQTMDNFLLSAREKWGGEAVQMGRATKVLFQYKNEGVKTVLGLIADQSALANSQSWTTFLNREAAFFSGPEKIAKHTNFPVFFAHTKRIKRGYYECNLSLLNAEPQKTSGNEILQAYVEKMEEIIRNEPECYLWSHKRWKHKRPEGIDII